MSRILLCVGFLEILVRSSPFLFRREPARSDRLPSLHKDAPPIPPFAAAFLLLFGCASYYSPPVGGDKAQLLEIVTSRNKEGQRWAFCESDNFGERAGGTIHRIGRCPSIVHRSAVQVGLDHAGDIPLPIIDAPASRCEGANWQFRII